MMTAWRFYCSVTATLPGPTTGCQILFATRLAPTSSVRPSGRLVRIPTAPDERPKAADYDAIVVSIGSSDNHPSFGSTPAIFRENLTRELERGGRWIALIPPGLKRALNPPRTEKVNKLIEVYADILTELIETSGGIAINVRAIIGPLRHAAFDDDGMHLTRAAYQELVPKIADAIATISR